MTDVSHNSGDERCSRCRMRLSEHGKAWIDRNKKHHICPIVRGSVSSEMMP
jgi:hypothetical protein